jgi:DNA-binding CsgD family transcriptional regulator
MAMVVTDNEKPRDSYVYIRGDRNKRGAVTPRQFLEILAGPDRLPFYEGSGRRELALSIASRTNPLTSRVLVNRLWLHHFGAGIVSTPDDLGNMSDKPTHPELLDWLATNFVENGWSIKKMHKKILLSAAYRQSANPNTNSQVAQKGAVDPFKVDSSNKFIWHANLRRLDFESIRDSMLVLSGKLDRALGGRAVNITDEPYSYRRTIYGFIDRDRLSELHTPFDFADPAMAHTKRSTTIVPQQALFFMNNPLAIEVARNVTSRPELLKATSDSERISQLYRIMYQRSPTVPEMKVASEFIARIAGRALVRAAGSADTPGEPFGQAGLFSSREREVLLLLTKGKSNKEIARDLSLSEATVKFHLKNVFGKLGVSRRAMAVSVARGFGFEG